MNRNNRSIPEWDAPVTLVPRVMRAVADQQAQVMAQGFFVWSAACRWIFWCTVAAAVVAGTALSMVIDAAWDPASVFFAQLGRLDAWLAAVVTLRNAIFAALYAFSSKPIVIILFLGSCLLTMATWTAGVSGLYYVLNVPQRRLSL